METKKLFSSLSAKKKDKVFQNTIDLVINTIGLSKGLRNEIRKQIEKFLTRWLKDNMSLLTMD